MFHGRIQVISPHRDDAAFSLGSILSELAARQVAVTVFNCFTVSEYAPFSEARSVDDVSELRRSEDVVFAEKLGAGTRFVDLDFLDAPLRLNVDSGQVCTVLPASDPAQGSLSRRLSELLAAEPVIIPLGLGGHVDHRLAREEALTGRPAGAPLAFYEDLPYAIRSADADAESRGILRTCGIEAEPLTCRVGRPERKRALVAGYASQAPPEIFGRMAEWRQGGERLWVSGNFRKFWRQIGLDS